MLFAAERTLLAWQRCSLALMGFGFVIERFSIFLSVMQHQATDAGHHLFSLLVGVAFIVLGSAVAIAASVAYRGFVRKLPARDVPPGYWTGLGAVINLIIGFVGIVLAAYLVIGAL